MSKPVLISGAGLASLLLARSLLRSRIPFLVFERDASLQFRGQGYRLRLSTEGLDAIEEVLGPEGWQKFYDRCSKTGGAGFVAYDAVTGEKLEEQALGLTSREGKTVGISRGDMRALFMEGCEEFVHWQKHVKGYELTDDGVKAVFADGTTSVEGSLLVAGEGIRSEVAKQVSKGALKVFDTGARGIHGQAPSSAFRQLGEGVFRITDTSKPGNLFVITNVKPEDKDKPGTVFGWTMGGAPGAVKAPNDNYSIIGKGAADIARDLTKDWDPLFRPLFENMIEEDAAFWKITFSTPDGIPAWDNEPRVTVIGDAVHSVSPAGGLGANTAVRDSALLGRMIKEAGGYRPGLTKEYEEKMKVYANQSVEQSWNMSKTSFGLEKDLLKKTVDPGVGGQVSLVVDFN